MEQRGTCICSLGLHTWCSHAHVSCIIPTCLMLSLFEGSYLWRGHFLMSELRSPLLSCLSPSLVFANISICHSLFVSPWHNFLWGKVTDLKDLLLCFPHQSKVHSSRFLSHSRVAELETDSFLSLSYLLHITQPELPPTSQGRIMKNKLIMNK